LDPLYVANEGKLLALVAPEAEAEILSAMKNHQSGTKAVVIGRVEQGRSGRVNLNTIAGGTRIVDMLTGEQLPRIC
jgi:hydrogenase expression/formation protein HypE